MKKTLLALLLSFPLFALAQSLQLSEPKVVTEGTLMKATIKVSNVSGNSLNVKVKRTIETIANGHEAYFCWGDCYVPEVSESPNAKTIAGGGYDNTSFYGDVETYGMAGLTKVTYCFFDAKSALDQSCFTFTYNVENGVAVLLPSDDQLLSAISPNPVSGIGRISFDLSGRKYNEASLVVRNLTGAIVKNTKISQASGELSVNADDLGSGIYMYSLLVDGKAILTRKMTVTK